MIWCLDMIWYTQFGGNSKISGTATLIAGHISISKIPGTAALNRNSHYQVLASQDRHQHWVSKVFRQNVFSKYWNFLAHWNQLIFKSCQMQCLLKAVKLTCLSAPLPPQTGSFLSSPLSPWWTYLHSEFDFNLTNRQYTYFMMGTDSTYDGEPVPVL